MNIVIVNDYAHVAGGAGQVALINALEAARAGHHVILFTGVGPVLDDIRNIPNLTVICLNQFDILSNPRRVDAVINGIWNGRAAREFASVLEGLDPKETIIHVHALSKALSTSIIPRARGMGYKTIYHMHDYGVVCPNMGFYCFPDQAICRLRPLSLACLARQCDRRSYVHKGWRVVRQLVQKTLGHLPRGIDGFIAVSRFSHDILQPCLPVNIPVSIINNPINVPRQPRVEVETNRYYMFIGRLDEEKNPQLLARAAYSLSLPVYFVGDGPCRKEILTINPDAVVTGWLPHHDVQQLLELARVVVLPSNWYETQGMIVSEAAARGVPSIVSKTCAATEFIIRGTTGLTFETNDVNDLMKKMQFLQDDSVVGRMGAAVYEYFWSNPHDVRRYMTEILALYARVMKRD